MNFVYNNKNSYEISVVISIYVLFILMGNVLDISTWNLIWNIIWNFKFSLIWYKF